MVGMLKIPGVSMVLLTKYEHLSILIAGMSAGTWQQMEKNFGVNCLKFGGFCKIRPFFLCGRSLTNGQTCLLAV